MGGFENVIGFMFSFFIIIAVFIGTFYTYQSQVIQQQQLTQDSLERTKSLFYDKFEISSAYVSNKRLLLTLDNLNLDDIVFSKKDGFNCFSFFVNNKYISVDNSFISVGGDVTSNYRLIEGKKTGHIILNGNFDKNADLSIKVINCQGVESFFKLNAVNNNWFDTNWRDKKSLNIENIAIQDVIDYQVRVDFNSSNLNFNKLALSDIRVLSSSSNFLVLGLGFDEYFQNLIDYSDISNDVVLGNSIIVESSDPSFSKNDGILNSLKFDGVSDFINITANSNLEVSKSLTYSAWVKWDGAGSAMNNIFTNGDDKNSIRIVSDGGVNDGKVMFKLNIAGGVQTIYSNITLDNSWHFVTATFDGYNMILYIDAKEVGKLTSLGDVVVSSTNNYIGSNGVGSFFNGNIDEVSVFNIALNPDDIFKLYEARLDYINLDFYVYDFDLLNKKLGLYVKIPFIRSGKNVTIDMFSNTINPVLETSNIENTFTYLAPRNIGYVLNDRISATGGVSVFSLSDDNDIIVGSNALNLNFTGSSTIASSSVNFNDKVYLSKLANVEGNANAVDMITPISWAGVEFDFRGFRNNADRFCFISPWGVANVSISDAGVVEWNGTVDSSGICVTNDIATANTLTIISNISILASYVSAQDSFVLSPAKSNIDLYGSPSTSMYIATGVTGANVNWYKSSSSTLGSRNLASYDNYGIGGNGGDGSSDAYRVWADNKIGVIQQADNDGSESTVFVPKSEFSTLFGSAHKPSYLSVVSDVSDAGCVLYDTSDVVILNVTTGVGGNGIYKYNFGTGNDIDVLPGAWYLRCNKSVWPYYENTVFDDDETNLIGYLQMKQYVYPEPIVIIN